MTNKILTIGLIVVLFIAIGGYSFPNVASKAFGAITGETNLNTLGVTGLKIGANCGDSFGSSEANGCVPMTHLIPKTCNLLGMNVSHAATTTKPYDCAVTGVTSSDSTIAQLASSTAASGFGGWTISGSKASTTAGFVTVLVTNLTGAAAVPSATSVGTSTAILIFQ